MSCLGRFWTKANQPKKEPVTEDEAKRMTGEKKVSLVINNVKVKEIPLVMELLNELREAEKSL